MTQLPKQLHNFLSKDELFFQFFQENCAEGYWFWEISKTDNLLLGSTYAAKHNLQAGSILLSDLKNKELKESISNALQKIEGEQLTTNQEQPNLDIKDKFHHLNIQYKFLEDHINHKHFIFASLQNLKKDQKLLDEIVDLFGIATWQWNIQTNEMIINEKYADILGYSLQELSPMNFSIFEKLSHPEDLIETTNTITEYLSGTNAKFTGETRLRHKKGNWIWVEAKGKLLSRTADGEPEWLIGSHIDISEKKLEELELGSLPLVALKTDISVIIADKQGEITFINKGFKKLTGYGLQEVVGKKPGKFLQGPETDPEHKKALRQKIKSGKPFTQEILNYTKHGKKYWTSLHVNPIYNKLGELDKFLSIQTDISEQKKFEEHLITFKSTLDQTEDCVFLFDKDSFEFIYVNKGAELMMEYTKEELLKLHPYDIKPEFTAQAFKELVEPLKNGERNSLRFETIQRPKSGKEIQVEVFIQYVKNEVNKPHFINIVRDITERKHLEKEMQRLSLVAEKTNNLVVISDKSGLIEYVNPAFEQKTGYSLSEVIGEKPGYFLHGPETDPAHIQANRENLKKLKPFTQEILNYTRTGEKYWASITFNPVFNAQGKLEKYIEIETDITERRNKEQKLQESEERLSFVLKGSEQGYWDYDLKTEEFTINDRWLEILGYTREEITPSLETWLALVHPEDKVKLLTLTDNIFSSSHKNDFSNEIRAKHKDGYYVWILYKGAVVERNKEGKTTRIAGIHSDISKRKRLEEILEEERAFLAGIMNNNAAAVVVLNTQGIIKYTNPSAHKVIGFSKDMLEGKAFNDPGFKMFNIDGTALTDDVNPFTILKKAAKPVYDLRMSFEAPDKTLKYISLSGAPITVENEKVTEFVFSILDITEKVKVQLQLEHTKSQLESILSEMSDVVYSFSLPDFKLIYITPAIEKLSGLEENYYKGFSFAQDWKEIIYEKDRSIVTEITQKLEKTGQYEVTYRIVTTSNEIKHVIDKGKYIYKDNKAVRLDGYLADITEKVKKENELKKYLKVVEGQNERLKNFTYIVSHNLRSHSANMKGLMYLIKNTNPEIYENEYVQKLELTSSKLDDTLYQLNEIVSVVSSVEQLKKVNVYSVLECLQKAFFNLLKSSNVKFINKVDESLFVEAVTPYLESILTNLITNSIKYSDSSKESYVKLWNETSEDFTSIYVQDNGLGIDLEKYGDKIFGMYKTFHSNKDSKGIGLFLAKNQAESMGGKIEVESEVGKGSTFKLKLRNGIF